MSKIIKLHDKFFKHYIDAEQIDKAIDSLVSQVLDDLDDEEPVFIGILNGSFIFMADFIRKYPSHCQVNFVKLASYEGTSSTGKVNQVIGLTQSLEEKRLSFSKM
jgi:adenylate kinase